MFAMETSQPPYIYNVRNGDVADAVFTKVTKKLTYKVAREITAGDTRKASFSKRRTIDDTPRNFRH